MAYLSRIWLNPRRQQGRRLLGDPQAMHAAVLGGIPNQPVTERVLWRVDADEPRRPALFVLSESAPSWEHLVEQAGWPSAAEPQAATRPYELVLDRVVAGRSFAFRLTANPTQSTRRPEKAIAAQERGSDGPQRSVRLGHRTSRHQLRWLLDRTSRWGFEVPAVDDLDDEADDAMRDVRIAGRARRSFRRSSRNGGGGRVTLQVVTYEGRLVVTDASALRSAMVHGMGPAKAYGCGLMTLAPLIS